MRGPGTRSRLASSFLSLSPTSRPGNADENAGMSGGERLPPEGRLDLDWEELFLSLDATRMRDRLAGLPFQCQEGWAQSRDCDVPPSWSGVERVVIGGMGGSAIAGDLAADLAAGQCAGPVIPVRDFSLPFSLNRHTLFVACQLFRSNGGNPFVV